MVEPLARGTFPTPLESAPGWRPRCRRAMAGLAAAAEPGSRVVFLHTGGLPGLFAADPATIIG
ncbi:hypothetical protein ACQP2E_12340 [Actinoplanes sp. CA-015351]|uniref:hypothetical protein n=1 Tax=Actinoplanes sp. CA-015351 TaxID=3239897 RepID=UPI003D98D37E